MQLAKLAGVTAAGHDHFYKVLRVTAQWELLDETPEGRLFSANAATRELVRGKDASLGHFVDHQVLLGSAFVALAANLRLATWMCMYNATFTCPLTR